MAFKSIWIETNEYKINKTIKLCVRLFRIEFKFE